ncbi:MAG TPA: pyridoxamine 5'-phosphate oxidase [Bacteroidia bacterium]|nr:pyridoxamine 5'-phosphate oxidase [Bacteroidia bacterium]
MKHVHNYIKGSRTDYNTDRLDISNAEENPVIQFSNWFSHALDSGTFEPHAMVLSTVSENGNPSSRVVLLRDFNEDGFVFYTNYGSSKGRDLEQVPKAAINFFWHELEKQIRIEGVTRKLDPAVSDAYFATRPRESQIGAWASQQSEVLSSRDELDQKVAELSKQFEGTAIPRPPNWGGFLIVPHYFEFWQGRPNRLHDRLSYTLVNNKWLINRLFP